MNSTKYQHILDANTLQYVKKVNLKRGLLPQLTIIQKVHEIKIINIWTLIFNSSLLSE